MICRLRKACSGARKSFVRHNSSNLPSKKGAMQVYYLALSIVLQEGLTSKVYYGGYEKEIPRVLRSACNLNTLSTVLAGHTGLVTCLVFLP